MDKLARYLLFSPEVQKALEGGWPVVAFPSCGIAAGLPRPHNVRAAQAASQAVRAAGAVPAVVAVLDGKLRIGLSDVEVEFLGEQHPAVPLAGQRDIPLLLACGGGGATTVAATLMLAALAGIRVVATEQAEGTPGGPGMVSADLAELAQAPVVLVCGGLAPGADAAGTRRQLQAGGVPVIGRGAGALPHYPHPEPPPEVNPANPALAACRFSQAGEIAAVFSLQESLGMRAGLLVVNPVEEAGAEAALAEHARLAVAIAHELG